ncbi:MAG: cysteine desulfurase NifS [Nanoarchaeota archaeon]|nr:cysteine desulfurase NifS [Nanoarchaeota archaeon]
MNVYLDNGATTIVDKEVEKVMLPYFDEKYGNPSSIHTFGQEAKAAIEKSRETIANILNADPSEIFFTSGGTESNNWTIKGVAFANKEKGKHIITTKVEHDCVLESCSWLEKQGFEVTYLDVDEEGFVKIDELKKNLRKDTILVSIIHGNNEIGTLNDLDEIGKICKENKVYFHTDACQSFTKVPLDVKKTNIDLVTINSHKIYGPKGVGALYIRKGTKVEIWQHGGGHESGKRAGTENVPGIVGFAKASQLTSEEDIKRMSELRDYFIEQVEKNIHEIKVNGPRDKRLCNNVNIIFKYIEGEGLLIRLDDKGVEASTGSACSSKSLEPSHVLTAMGIPHSIAHGSLRFSLSKYTTKEELDYALKMLKDEVANLRDLSPLWDSSREKRTFKGDQ